MKKLSPLLVAVCMAVALPASTHAQVYQASDFTYETYGEVRTNGNDSTYSQGLTHRYVGGELRFLTLTLQRHVQEFRLPAPGQTQTSTTGDWDLSGTGAFLNGFHGIWFEQAKNRLWITSAEDYTATNHPARVTIVSLGSGGSATVIKQFFLDKPAKRVYGGCQAVPASLVSQLGGPYVCGWGGYTSLVMQGGNASIGPTMYAIPDPDTVANGATVSARTILDAATAQSNRGVRLTKPLNYFDGGDPRNNPPTRPTAPPSSTASWLSPNAQGLGWMVWGDSYYNTGVWIGETFAAVASLCGVPGATTTTVGTTTVSGSGACWYQSSTLAFDGRQFELHTWDGSKLGNNAVQRPDDMVELRVPIDPSRQGGGAMGNRTVGNLAGATYDSVSGRLYIIGIALSDSYTSRLYSYRIGSPSGQPPAFDSLPPTVSLTAPGSGTIITGTTTLSAAAADNTGVAGVWFTVDGQVTGVEDSAPPYQIAWNSSSVASGTHTIRAVARDAAGNVATSAAVSVTVGNASADTTPPSVTVTTPSTGATISGIVTVAASASDNVGVASVQFTLNGVNLGAPDGSAPYAINWNTAGAVNGTHALRAMARDAAGNVTLSTTRLVAVANSSSGPSGCLTPDPFIALGGGSCDNGNWLPPDMPDSDAEAAPAPTTPSSTSTSCTTVQPGSNWTCNQGSWFPPGMTPQMSGGATGGSTNPTPTPTPTPAPIPSTCPSSKPASDWVCVAGGWLPPTHPLALVYLKEGALAPPPAALPGSTDPVVYPPGVCASPIPGSGWVCVGGGWVPSTHPLALASEERY
ncbi:MAG: hypothetical protein IT183_09240 [Acidobacteria bacterium]|nr:hypothetical protein [Acidobacteriota bacterium]